MRPDARLLLLPLVALLAPGCISDQGTLARLQDAYGDQTVAALEDPLTATVLVSALAVDLCITTGTGSWGAADPGQTPPMDYDLADALGNPLVGQAVETDALALELTGVALLGGTDRLLEATAAPDSPFQVNGTVLDAADGQVLGSFDLSVVDGCSTQWARVSGTASWANQDDTWHAFTLPASGSSLPGVDWPGLTTWLPAAGSIAWKGTVGDADRAFHTDDATAIERFGAGALWPGVAYDVNSNGVGPIEWETTITAEIQPL